MKPRLRRWLKRGIVALAILVALIVVASFLVVIGLQTDFGRERVRRIAETTLDDMFVGDVRIGRLEGSVFGELVVRDIVVEDAQGRPAISVTELRVEVGLLSLLGKRVEVPTLRITGLDIIARQDAGGELNLATLTPPGDGKPSKPSPWKVAVTDIDIAGSARLYRAGDEGELLVENISPLSITDASLTIGGGQTRLALGEVAATATVLSRSIEASGTVTMEGKRLALDGLRVTTAGGELDIAKVALLDGRPAQVEATLKAEAALVTALAPDSRLRGDVRVEVSGDDSATSGELGLDISITVGAARVTGHAIIDRASNAVTATLATRSLDLAGVWGGLPVTTLDLDVTASASGTGLPDLVASATARGGGVVAGRSITDVSASLGLAKQGVTLQARATPEDGTLSVHATGSLKPTIAITHADVIFKHDALERLGQRDVDVRGDIDVNLDLDGALDALHVAGTVSSRRLRGFGVSVADLSIAPDVTRTPKAARGQVIVGASSVRAGGTTVRRAFIKASSTDGVSGTLEMRGRGKGVFIDLATAIARTDGGARADIDRLAVGFASIKLAGRNGSVSYDWNNVAVPVLGFDRVALRSAVGVLELDGDVTTTGQARGAFKIKARRVELGVLSRALALSTPLAGTLTVDATLDTERGTPTASLDVFGAGIAVGAALPATSGRVEVGLRRGTLTVDSSLTTASLGKTQIHAEVGAPRDPLDVRGWQRLDARAVRSLTLSTTIDNPSSLTHLHPEFPSGGRFALDVAVDGKTGVARATLSAKEVRSARLAEPARADLVIALEGAEVTAHLDGAVARRVTATADADAALPGPWRDPATWRQLDRSRVTRATAAITNIDADWWAEQSGIDLEERAATVAVNIELEPGTARDPAVVVTVIASQPAGGPRTLAYSTSAELRARIAPHRVEASVIGRLKSARHVEGEAVLKIGWRDALRNPRALEMAMVSGKVSLARLPLAAVRDQLRGTDLEDAADVDGTISGEATASGRLFRPVVAGAVQIDGAVVAGVGFRTLAASGSFRDGRVIIDAEGRQTEGGTLKAHASTNLSLADAGAPLTASINARRFDLAFLAELVPGRGIGGVLDASINVGGTRAVPILLGSAAIKRGRVLPGVPLYPMRDINLDVALGSNRVTARGTAISGRGTINLDASVVLDASGPRRLRATITSKKLPLEAGGLLMTINTTTRIGGRATGGVWKLVADVGETRIDLPDESARTLHATDRPGDLVFVSDLAKQPQRAKGRAPRPPITVELKVRAPGTIEVRGRSANAVFDADLLIAAGRELKITGTVRGERGSLDLFGHRYDIRRALVSFGGDPDPGLDVQLAHEFSAVTLYILVSGTGSNPVVELRSDPSQYDEAELLAFVLGASPDDGDGASLRNQATGLVTGVVAGRVQNLVSDITPIDVVKLKLGEDGTSAESLTLGRWLTSKLYVAYRHNFGADTDENSGEGTLEYRFWRRWLLEGYVGSKESGADVLFIKRY